MVTPTPKLRAYERELAAERAAIMEFDGRLTREEAEQRALAEILKQREKGRNDG